MGHKESRYLLIRNNTRLQHIWNVSQKIIRNWAPYLKMPSLISALFLTLFFLWLPLRSKSPTPTYKGHLSHAPLGSWRERRERRLGPFSPSHALVNGKTLTGLGRKQETPSLETDYNPYNFSNVCAVLFSTHTHCFGSTTEELMAALVNGEAAPSPQTSEVSMATPGGNKCYCCKQPHSQLSPLSCFLHYPPHLPRCQVPLPVQLNDSGMETLGESQKFTVGFQTGL
jgi:hypothetical protein